MMQILGQPAKKIIKSIQRGTVSFGTSDTVKSITIANVDMTKCIVRISSDNATINSYESIGQADMQSNTQFYISRNTNGTTQLFEYEVIEYNNVKSRQSGQVALTSNNQLIPIASINESKTICYSGVKTTATSIKSNAYNSCFVENATSLRHKGYNGGSIIHQTIEFK